MVARRISPASPQTSNLKALNAEDPNQASPLPHRRKTNTQGKHLSVPHQTSSAHPIGPRWLLSPFSAPARAWSTSWAVVCSTRPGPDSRRPTTIPRAPTPTCPSTPRLVSSLCDSGSTVSPASSPPLVLPVRHFPLPRSQTFG
jgi:hypothetical protein